MDSTTLLGKMVENQEKILGNDNGKKGSLLEIIHQVLAENHPTNYFLAMDSRISQGILDSAYEEVGVKVAFANKVFVHVLKALNRIYRIAKNNANRDIGYEEIKEIIEKEYPV